MFKLEAGLPWNFLRCVSWMLILSLILCCLATAMQLLLVLDNSQKRLLVMCLFCALGDCVMLLRWKAQLVACNCLYPRSPIRFGIGVFDALTVTHFLNSLGARSDSPKDNGHGLLIEADRFPKAILKEVYSRHENWIIFPSCSL